MSTHCPNPAEPTIADALAHLATAREIADRMIASERDRLVDELRQVRAASGLTQQQVADVIGVSRAQVANFESHKAGLSVEALIGYAAAIGRRLTFAEPR